ncbi:MAG: hypothetical protein KA166_02980 [Saprospiraceae bacterium]|nr:hypothetical protein [Saprospiraceae bacterium]
MKTSNLMTAIKCISIGIWLLVCIVPLAAQNVGIHTATPLAKLHVDLGASLSNGILFSGLDPSGGTFPSLGAGHRLMYYPGKGVFRAGYVEDTQWDNSQVGAFSFAFGYNPIARGNGSCAIGDGVYAGGSISTAFGNSTTTKGYSSFVLGMYNDPLIIGADQDVETPQTPLLMVGNGDGNGARNNALTVFKNGDVLLKNYTTVTTDPGILQLPLNGPGTRMMWIPGKSAFRAGTVDSTFWDEAKIGTWSFATGRNTEASGLNSTAMGVLTSASGNTSFAFGNETKAIGISSMATGSKTQAIGSYSTAMGLNNPALGGISTVSGRQNIAKGYSSTVIGVFNDSILLTNQVAVNPLTPLLIIGNGDGTGVGQRRNAMVVRKDGHVGIGTNTPVNSLTVIGPAGNSSIPDTSSTGILRIGLNSNDGIDIGKMAETPFSGWIQVGTGDNVPNPLSIQPMGGNVGIGTSAPSNSAVLELNSTSQGFLPPRMTYAQRNIIANPPAGLIIWCSNCDPQQLQVSNGYGWTNLIGGAASPEDQLSVGDSYAGGIVAYLYQPEDPGYVEGEDHGFVMTPYDITSAMWGCVGEYIPGADGLAIGEGMQNTSDIVNGCVESPIAARECFEYESPTLYDDWILPSKDELYFTAGAMLSNGSYSPLSKYWSSSEVDSGHAYALTVDGFVPLDKSTLGDVRPIRYF